MIARLIGKLAYKTSEQLIVDVGGVGYAITVSLNTFSSLPETGENLQLLIHTHVREDQLTLFGFNTEEEKKLFSRLIGVSGVGPKVALAILSGLPPAALANAIITEDRSKLNSIPGVGKKTAERIIIDLKDKLSKETFSPGQIQTSVLGKPAYDDALSALTNLGYKKQSAEMALNKLDWSQDMPLESAIRHALKELVPQ